uniref:ShKT domain-containing protein n=1 Tax=Caenorhabditis tropicalis TaxID=1561998 RepID=A0A1I7T9Q2_9PELO
MAAFRLVALLVLLSPVTDATDCVDLLDVCESLQTICIGSILTHHFNVISDLSSQMNDSTLPALESSLPLIQSDLPLVLGSNEDGSSTAPVERSASSSPTSIIDEETLKNALPLLKESLPLIRESLPLIRESLPLIRDYLDPIVGKTDCQRKATCRSKRFLRKFTYSLFFLGCKDCPKLRDTIIQFVEALCPSTCKVCTSGSDLLASSSALSTFFS